MKKYTRLHLLIKLTCFVLFFYGMTQYTNQLLDHKTDKSVSNKQDTPLEQTSTTITTENSIQQLHHQDRKNKKIYIYSTHQQEEYVGGNVVEGSKYLSKMLTNLGYEVVVEESNFDAYSKSKGMNYNQLYNVSNTFLTEAIVKHGGFDLNYRFS